MLFKVCRKKKHEAKPGEILDQVISQSSSMANKCLLYKLANYKRGKYTRYRHNIFCEWKKKNVGFTINLKWLKRKKMWDASKLLIIFISPKGGDLIDAFQKGGQISVETLIREQFGTFMYNNGKGQVINRAEYLRWKYMDNKEVVIPIEASLSHHDPLGKWYNSGNKQKIMKKKVKQISYISFSKQGMITMLVGKCSIAVH